MKEMDRRTFLSALGAGVAAEALGKTAFGEAVPVKPITGSSFEFQHHETVEGVNWNPACACFSCDQWDAKIKEMKDIGIDTLILMSTALFNRAFYKTSIYPKWDIHCDDPLETALTAADKYGVRFFVSNGFYGNFDDPKIVSDPDASKKRLRAIEELANGYAHHPSFYGWYWPDEAFIDRYYSQDYIDYVNASSKLARQLTPRAKILISPYGTRVAIPDDRYVKQLESLDVDIVDYQDEVGVRKSTPDETGRFFEGLKKAHDRVGGRAIWADVEVFNFEGAVYQSALIPAPFSRVLRQLEAVSPWVEKISIYIYLGLMNKPGSKAFAGPPESTHLYTDYKNWLSRRT